MNRPAMSVQLYTVRDRLDHDPEGTIAAIAELGFTAVEPFGLPALPEDVRAAITAHGLDAPTAHGSLLTHPRDTIAAAAALGVRTIIEPYQDPARFTDRASVAAVAAELNAAAAEAAEHGLAVGYHNHDGELRGEIDGLAPLLLLAELTDPAVVIELDAYWAHVAGVDPVAIARALGDRVVAVHVKDGEKGDGVENQVPAGRGSVPLAAVLAAVPHARPVIEFDVVPGEGWQAIAASAAFVSALVAEEVAP